MSVELIYKTSNPDVVAWMLDLIERRVAVRKLRIAYAAKMLEEFGPIGKRFSYNSEDDPTRALVGGRYGISGVGCRIDEQPPEDSGWRLDAKTKWWMPKLATKRGKERAAELIPLRQPRANHAEIGIDEPFFGDGFMYYPTLMYREDLKEVWVVWGSYECRNAMETGEFGWTEVQRSEWYAWRERVDAGLDNEAAS